MDRPPLLDDDEQRAWRAFIDGSQLVRDRIDRTIEASAPIPAGYYGILVALSEAPDQRMRMGDLAAATLSSPSRLSHAVGKLEVAGWVERTACGVDGRGLDAVLTDAGLAALESAVPAAAAAVREHFLDLLDARERAVIAEVFERVRHHLARTAHGGGRDHRAGACAGDALDACDGAPTDSEW